MACMAAWICVKLRHGLSGIGLSFLVLRTAKYPASLAGHLPGLPGA